MVRSVVGGGLSKAAAAHRFNTTAKTPVEGRDLSSRRTHNVVRTWRLGNLSTPKSVQKHQMALHAAYSGLRLPWCGNSSGRANRFYVTFLAILAAVKSIGLR